MKHRLCVITDTNIQKKYSHIELAKMAIKGGADIIQLRDKTMPTGGLAKIALRIKKLCEKKRVMFIVNDRVDIAMVSNADGVHLGKEDMPVADARKLLGKDKIIGATAHSLSEALKAEKSGADYIGFGHIYHTSTKIKSTKPKGLNQLRKVCGRLKIPVIAIGGISLENATDVTDAGAEGIAVVGSIVRSKYPDKETAKIKEIING